MKTLIYFSGIFVMISTLIFAGCVKTPVITEVSSNESYEGLYYENMLVIGVTAKITFRNLLEARLAKQLQEQGLNPLPAYSILPYSNDLSRGTVSQAVEKSGTEAILFICLIETGGEEAFALIDKSNPYVFYENLRNMVSGSSETGSGEEQTFFLASSLYDARSEKQIWSLSAESDFKYKIKSLNEAIALVVSQLKASGLI